MRQFRWPRGLVLTVCLGLLAGAGAQASGQGHNTVARLWNEEVLDAIRLDIPKPTVHSRNLFHVSAAMWDAWATYDASARGYLFREKHTASDVEAAREEAISYAAYRVLKYRYRFGPGEAESQASFDALMDDLGHDKTFTSTTGSSPAAIGNRIGDAVIAYGQTDGANEGPLLDYADDSGYVTVNDPLVFKLPGTTMNDANRWQPLAFEVRITQNGIEVDDIQEFINPNWGQVLPFALTPEDLDFPYVYLDPGPPPQLGGSGDAEFKANAVQLISLSSFLDPGDGVTLDISPGAIGNNPLGTNDGTGHPLNPFTGQPYAANVVKRADFGRVVAEFWADGPDSETPPGHWNVLANEVSEHPLFNKQIGGRGRTLGDLEWYVKLYFALNGAVHDAAIVAWGCKGYYDYSRPISHIRHMGGLGQSSDPGGLSYHPDGLPLVPDLVEVITLATLQPGQRHAHLFPFIGQIAIRAWRGGRHDPATEIGGVQWIRAKDWRPYQRETFVTPAFAGYVSGHSAFSRAAAEVMAAITGNVFFPGGLGTFVADMNQYLQFELGPEGTVALQWATYFDAADQAGQSRLWGGIHPIVDDLPARQAGSDIGKKAWVKAQEFFGQGKVTICHLPSGNPSRARTISVGSPAAAAHLAHGDLDGTCEAAQGLGARLPHPSPKKPGKR